MQSALHKTWHWFFDGCNLNRDTGELLQASGFRELRLERFPVYSPFFPVTPHIAGYAMK